MFANPTAPARSALSALLGSVVPGADGPERISVPRGSVLIEQGSAPRDLFFVETGRFVVERDGVELAEIGAGGTLGEISFFTGRPRSASVVAARDSVVIRLSQAEYDTACARDPGLARQVARDLALRLEATSARARRIAGPPQARTLALIGAGTAALPGWLAAGLSAALVGLGAGGRVIHRADAVAALGGTPGEADLIAWLHGMEQAGAPVILVADPEDTAWSRLILRQADQVVIVGQAGPVPPLSAIERLAFDILPEAQRRLILLHPLRRDRVTGTAAWLETRPVFMHHHMVPESLEDLGRVARFLAGRALGFVAGGGGAFGALHTGVYAGLRDKGLAFDIFGGTSVGAAMCAAFAMGLSPDEIDTRTGDIFVTNAALGRLTVPRYALLDHTVFDRQLKAQYGEGAIEDLWLPFFAVASDLSDNRLRVIRRGPLWQAVRASAAIPGALPPFYTPDGSMLVDGGCMDNLPYRTMHALKSGPNVLVSFDRGERQAFDVAYDALPGRGRLLRYLLLPFLGRPPRAPGIIPVVMRSVLARQAAEAADLKPQDWHIRAIPPRGAHFLNWTTHTAFMETGRALVGALLEEPHGEDDPRHAVMQGALP